MDPKRRKLLDWLLILVVNFMWATQVTAIKLIGDRLGPVAITFVPMVVGILIFLPLLWRQNRRRGGSHFRWADAKHFLIAGLFGSFLIQFTYTLGSQRTLAANAGIITLTIPVFCAIAASFLVNERLNPVRVVAFFLALAGVLMTSVSDLRGANFVQTRYLAGNLLFLAACASSGFFNAYCKLLVERKYTELEILVYTTIIAAAGSIPMFMFLEPLDLGAIINAGATAILALLEIAVVVYGVSMLLFFSVLKRLDVTQAVLGNYLLPFFIALLAIAVLKESITALMAAGGAIVLLSTLMVTVYENEILRWFRRTPEAAPRRTGARE